MTVATQFKLRKFEFSRQFLTRFRRGKIEKTSLNALHSLPYTFVSPLNDAAVVPNLGYVKNLKEYDKFS